jgi:FAD/FMN-containing dehydrogenase
VSVPQLRAAVSGQVIAPGDAGYDEGRTIFYGGFDQRPAVIVRVADEADVARVVSLARESGLPLAVRSGGHSTAGHSMCDGGIVLDLADLRALRVDPERRTAWAGPGLTTGEYTTAAAAHGLATGFGDAGSVGIGGITLGGGVGYLVRKHGLTIDSLLAADLVTADGQLLRVDAQTHPDLFWAIRGGGGNFGVVTQFQFRLHPVGTAGMVVGGMLLLPATPEVIAGFIAEALAAPDELSAIANIVTAPPLPFVPPEHHGRLVVMAMLVHAGGGANGEQAVAAFRKLATPIADMVGPAPYPDMFPPMPDGYHPVVVGHTGFLDAVDRHTAQIILDQLSASTASMRVTQLRALGGAAARVPADATAFAHRDRPIMVNVGAVYEHPDEAATHQAWVEATSAALGRGDSAAYVNFLMDEGADRVRDAYPGRTWDRLTEIKRRYDPTNLFRLNQNIPPHGK